MQLLSTIDGFNMDWSMALRPVKAKTNEACIPVLLADTTYREKRRDSNKSLTYNTRRQ